MSSHLQTATKDPRVPSALRGWFIVHFWADILFALPIFFAPQQVLSLLGWTAIDPFTARLSAAALMGIGVESLLGRNAGLESFKGMLQLKIIWSGFATIGLAWSAVGSSLRYPWVGWVFVGIFVAFHALWWFWRLRLAGVRIGVNRAR